MTERKHVVWRKALDPDELPEGRVAPRTIGVHTVCMTHFDGTYAALSNKCPHQGGPLGEGSIENGLLTASLKVKRKIVVKRYEDLINEMYSNKKK